jgi:hypothetical protein
MWLMKVYSFVLAIRWLQHQDCRSLEEFSLWTSASWLLHHRSICVCTSAVFKTFVIAGTYIRLALVLDQILAVYQFIQDCDIC